MSVCCIADCFYCVIIILFDLFLADGLLLGFMFVALLLRLVVLIYCLDVFDVLVCLWVLLIMFGCCRLINVGFGTCKLGFGGDCGCYYV